MAEPSEIFSDRKKSADEIQRTFSYKWQFVGEFVIKVSSSYAVRGKRGSNFSVFR